MRTRPAVSRVTRRTDRVTRTGRKLRSSHVSCSEGEFVQERAARRRRAARVRARVAAARERAYARTAVLGRRALGCAALGAALGLAGGIRPTAGDEARLAT